MIYTAERENAAAFTALPDVCTQSAGSATGSDHINRIAYDLITVSVMRVRLILRHDTCA